MDPVDGPASGGVEGYGRRWAFKKNTKKNNQALGQRGPSWQK